MEAAPTSTDSQLKKKEIILVIEIPYVSVKKSKWIYVHHMRNKIHLISNAE